MSSDKRSNVLTTTYGAPVGDAMNSLTAGRNGPVLMTDINQLDKQQTFNRERVPERVVHAKGAAAHGYFEVTQDISDVCCADFLKEVGKRTDAFVRFSNVGGERGFADAVRDPRGFALKLYTEEGNMDIVMNNLPIFFMRDPILFPDLIHSQKRHPSKNTKEAESYWDFLTNVPESVHIISMLYSDRGIPATYREMDGFGNHTFIFVNDAREITYAKIHFKAELGCRNLTEEEAILLRGAEPDSMTRDLFEHIEGGGEVGYRMYVQLMTKEQAETYKYDVFDVTKVWLHKDAPLKEVGRLVLNRNVTNFFEESEQSAFCPANLVPGIQPSFDKMFQARIMAYKDAQRYRIGANFHQLPVNCPFNSKFGVRNHLRDGNMCIRNQGDAMPYYGNSMGYANETVDRALEVPLEIHGQQGRFDAAYNHPNDDFDQPRLFWCNVLSDDERKRLASNIGEFLSLASKPVQDRMCEIFGRVHETYEQMVRDAIKFLTENQGARADRHRMLYCKAEKDIRQQMKNADVPYSQTDVKPASPTAQANIQRAHSASARD